MQLRTNAWWAVTLTVLISATSLVSTSSLAQEAPRAVQPDASSPGASAVEPRTVPPRPSTSDDRRGGARTEPETQRQPHYEPRGGCHYRERTLELIV